jgi:hypothetical protein
MQGLAKCTRVATTSFILLAATIVFHPLASGATTPQCKVINRHTRVPYVGTGSNLQTAIDEASGAVLDVRGLCVGTFALKGVSLVGVQSAAYPDKARLDGDAAGTVLSLGAGQMAVVTDIDIVNGASATSGGGVSNSGNLLLRNCAISGNTAGGDGGAIYNAGQITIGGINGRVSPIEQNSATNGGGVYNAGNLVLHSDVSYNSASLDGGGIYNATGRVEIGGDSKRALVANNTSGRNGGGIYNNANLDSRQPIEQNSAAADGGGVYNDTAGTFVLQRWGDSARVQGNTAGGSGGGVANLGAVTLRRAASIAGNTADQGGGVHNVGTLSLEGYTTVVGNTAAQGGGVFNDGTVNRTEHSRIRENTATGNGDRSLALGGGIYNDVAGVLNGIKPGTNVLNNTPDNVFQAA